MIQDHNTLFFIYSFMKKNLAYLDPSLLAKLEDRTRNMTLFLPTDDAFAKIPFEQQSKIDQNVTYLSKVL